MKENFASALRMTLGIEGNILDDPDDAKRAGGITNLGITQRTWDSAVKRGLVPDIPLKTAQRGHAALIYRQFYWDRVKGDELPGPIDALAFDFAVNSGVYPASVRLQASANRCGANLTPDGIIGPKTIRGVWDLRMTPRGVCLAAVYLLERVDAYSDLLSGNPKTDPDYKWIRGWLKRIGTLRTYAGL